MVASVAKRVLGVYFSEGNSIESQVTMTQKYALPCGCGNNVPVDVRQAGNQASCPQCAALLDVPRLRELKKLETLDSETAPKEPAAWSGLPGGLFAFGLLLLAIAGGSAYYTYNFRTAIKDYAEAPTGEVVFEHDIQDITLVDSWEAWNKFKDIEIASRNLPYHVYARGKVAAMNKWLIFYGGLAGAGLISMFASVFMRPSTR